MAFVPERRIGEDIEVRRDYERLRIGHDFTRAVGSEPDLERLLPRLLDNAFDLVGAERGAILLMNSARELVPRFVKTRDSSEIDIILSKNVAAEVIETQAAVLSRDLTTDARFSAGHSVIMNCLRATMAVPLMLHRAELLGIVYLDSTCASDVFTAKDVEIITGMAEQAALVIQNAQLRAHIENLRGPRFVT